MSKKEDTGFLQIFALDLRSLAFFRMLTGLVILLDLWVRSRGLEVHYTDFGLMPRSLVHELNNSDSNFSLHFITGGVPGEVILFLIHALFAFFLFIGFRTRLASLACWILAISIHNRNYYVNNAGDAFLMNLIFWALFLPLGAKLSVDAALNKEDAPKSNTYFSMACVGLISQILLLYIFAGWFKFLQDVWINGLGTYYAVSYEQFSTSIGKLLIPYGKQLKIIDPIILYLETFLPLLFLIPFRKSLNRMICILFFWGFHLSILVFFKVGFFSAAGLMAWTALLPSSFWERDWLGFSRFTGKKYSLYYDGECDICLKLVRILKMFLGLTEIKVMPAQSSREFFAEMEKNNSWIVVSPDGAKHFRFDAVCLVFEASWIGGFFAPVMRLKPFSALGTHFYNWFADHRTVAAPVVPAWHERNLLYGKSLFSNSIATFVFIFVLYWNFWTLGFLNLTMSPSSQSIGYLFRFAQSWKMFDQAIIDDGWFVVPGILKNGRELDIYKDGEPLSYTKPELVSATYPTDRYRKYMINLYQQNNPSLWLNYGRYLCRKWNRDHIGTEQLESLRVVYMREDINSDGTKQPVKEVELWKHRCF